MSKFEECAYATSPACDFRTKVREIFRETSQAVKANKTIHVTCYDEFDILSSSLFRFLRDRDYSITKESNIHFICKPMSLIDKMNKMRGESWE